MDIFLTPFLERFVGRRLKGHASLVEGPDGSWWSLYHGYEKGFWTLGRQCLLDPVAWTADESRRLRAWLAWSTVLTLGLVVVLYALARLG